MRSKRLVLLLALVVLAGFLVIPRLAINWQELTASVASSLLSSLTNEKRSEFDLATLKTNPQLEQAAKLKAEDMARRGYFAHQSPEGRDFTYFLNQVGYDYEYAGENLAINFEDSSEVVNAWMQSPGHRENILKGRYTEMGVATASTTVKGKERVLVVQLFGTPREP